MQLEKFIYYSDYSHYNMSTIQLSKETKELISSFGSKEDTYEDIIKKMYSLAVKEHLREFLMNTDDCISIDDAIKEAKKRWQK
jgi:hypothetical protein